MEMGIKTFEWKLLIGKMGMRFKLKMRMRMGMESWELELKSLSVFCVHHIQTNFGAIALL